MGVVEAAVLTSEGGHDVHLPGLVAQGDPPAGVRVAVRGDSRGVHQAAGDRSPLCVGEVRLVGVGADRADPYRPLGCAGPETLDGGIKGLGQVGQRARLGEQFYRGSVAVARDQPWTGVVALFARPVQVGEQAGGVAGALQMGDHGVYLEGSGEQGPG
ncbi:hypothetical protein [Streptomyces sp. SID5468]|uniref:hypothetical protein n=1 Tax=Streptomyces sp. SID5468 TaxID=2690295 RepID=UPI0005A0E727|nr:hypothetical protein [Streptomyces sp. SID5468]MYS59717.1 hypothetical protein [Streptomyces sp. SID5468]